MKVDKIIKTSTYDPSLRLKSKRGQSGMMCPKKMKLQIFKDGFQRCFTREINSVFSFGFEKPWDIKRRQEKCLCLWTPETLRHTTISQGGGSRKWGRQTEPGEDATETKWRQVCHRRWVCNGVGERVGGGSVPSPLPPVGPVSVSWWLVVGWGERRLCRHLLVLFRAVCE